MRVTTDRLKARAEQLKKDGVRVRSNAAVDAAPAQEILISEPEDSESPSNAGNDEQKIAS